jgi:hypothetical protein
MFPHSNRLQTGVKSPADAERLGQRLSGWRHNDNGVSATKSRCWFLALLPHKCPLAAEQVGDEIGRVGQRAFRSAH